MAGATTNISIRMDSDLKAQADRLFGELGMNQKCVQKVISVEKSTDRAEIFAY